MSNQEETWRVWDERLAIYHFGRLIESISQTDKDVEEIDLEFREPNVYPDAKLFIKMKNGEEYHLDAEFEGFSSNFKAHGHDKNPAKCDLIICTLHDYEESKIPVLDAVYGKIFKPKESAKGSFYDEYIKLIEELKSNREQKKT
jgi:hypothetical protein